MSDPVRDNTAPLRGPTKCSFISVEKKSKHHFQFFYFKEEQKIYYAGKITIT